MTVAGVKTPEVYVDGVLFQLLDNELTVLLTQRTRSPFKGQWALPGGPDPIKQTTYQAMSHWVKEKTGVKVDKLGFIVLFAYEFGAFKFSNCFIFDRLILFIA